MRKPHVVIVLSESRAQLLAPDDEIGRIDCSILVVVAGQERTRKHDIPREAIRGGSDGQIGKISNIKRVMALSSGRKFKFRRASSINGKPIRPTSKSLRSSIK